MRRTRRPLAVRLALRTGSDHGATAAEYAIIAALIAVVIVAGVAAFGLAVNGLFSFPAGL